MPQRYVVSKFVAVSWADGSVQITSPVARETFTGDAALLHLLSTFAVPRTIEDAEATVIRKWIDAAILVDADVPEPAALHHWDPAALGLHASSRDKTFRKTPGHTTPAVAPRRFETTIPLAPASEGTAGCDLAALLGARRSRRAWASTPIPFQAFSDLFWLSARNRDDARGSVSRPYPSGGAAYSLELYPVLAIDAVETLSCGVYRYLPEAHALELISPFDVDARPFLAGAGSAAGTAPPPVAIVITSRYARQSEEYNRLAYSLVLKEVGALFQTLYLAAESLGLAACALGGGMPAGLLASLCGTTELEEPVVGELMIGAM
ncbi:MAG TPA: SagB family peptide dehydrogenase [Thermoanaerobaculia bacterium]